MTTRIKGSVFRTVDVAGYVSTHDLGPENTDITAALQAALLAGLAVCVTAGTWLVGAITIPAGSVIFGDGPKCVLKTKDNTNAVLFTVGANSLLAGFAIDGNKVNQVGTGLHSVNVAGVAGVTCSQLVVQNTKGSGIAVTGAASNATIQVCDISGFTESGIMVAQGTGINLLAPNVHDSDVGATGNGISIASIGSAITGVAIEAAVVRNVTGRGIALLGNGSRNVSSVSVMNARVSSCTSHGVHLLNADSCVVSGGVVNANAGDGIRLEGDVQNCRMVTPISRSNTGFGLREVTSGTSPNFNGLIYGVVNGNGSDVITKVGASSYIV